MRGIVTCWERWRKKTANKIRLSSGRGDDRKPQRRLARGLRLLGALLLDFLDLVDQVVGLLQEVVALFGGLHQVRLAAIQQVQVGHGIVVIGLELDRFLESGNAFVNNSAALGGVFGTDAGGKRVGVLNLFLDVAFVVLGAHFVVD